MTDEQHKPIDESLLLAEVWGEAISRVASELSVGGLEARRRLLDATDAAPREELRALDERWGKTHEAAVAQEVARAERAEAALREIATEEGGDWRTCLWMRETARAALDGEGPSTGYCCLSLEHFGTCSCDHALDGEARP